MASKRSTKVSPVPEVMASAPVVAHATPAAATPVVAAATPVVAALSPFETLQEQASKTLEQLTTMRTQIKDMENFLRTYMKETAKMMKSKGGRRRATRTDGKPKAPSGFAKKTKVTEVFAKFLQEPEIVKVVEVIKTNEATKEGGSTFETLDSAGMISRPSATKILNAYIREKNLQDPTAKKNFKPDARLKKILTPLTEEDTKKGGYSFFNLQRYTSHLYVKNPVVV